MRLNKTDGRLRAAVGAIAVTALLSMAAPVQAGQFQSLYQNTRVLGMGGAFTAVADDFNALTYNPAGLTQLDGMEMDLITVEAEGSESVMTLIDDLEAAQGGTEAAAADVIRAHVGDHIRLRLNSFPHVVGPRFGVGLLGQATVDGDFRNPVNPVVDVNAAVDWGITGALAKKMNSNLALGIGGKFISRKGLVRTYTALDVATSTFDPLADVGNPETDVAFDLGMLYHFNALPFSPTIGAAYLNAGNLDFGPFGEVPSQLNLGVAVRPKIGPFRVTLSADYVDVTKNLATDSDDRKRTNFGAEVALWKFLAVRAGVHQSYFSAGATLNLWVLKIDVATYGEELAAYGGQREDRRYIARIAIL